MEAVSLRVLLVEDNEDDYVIVRDLLADISSTRYDLQWVNTYGSAQEALTHHQYDVCLVDYRLGEATGVELVREFGRGQTPFILLTGREDYAQDVAATKAGASDYLLKGHINAPLLERSIRYAIEHKRVQQTLIQSQERLRRSETNLAKAQHFAQATVDALLDNIAVLDEHGTIITVNAAWSTHAVVGGFRGADSGVGMNYLHVCDHSAGEDARAAARSIRRVIAGKEEGAPLEYPCHTPSEKRWYEMTVSRFSSQETLHVVVAHKNITERKQAEERLRQSEANLSQAQQIAGLGSWELDLGNPNDVKSNPLRWSDENFRLFGYEPGQIEVTNENFFHAVHPDDRDRVGAAMEQALRGEAPYDIEHRVFWPDGSEHVIHGQGDIIYDPVSGSPLKIVGTGQDITQRKQLEEAKHFLASIVESSEDSILTINFDRVITSWNKAAEHLYGYAAQDVLGKHLTLLTLPEDLQQVLSNIERIKHSQKVEIFDTIRLHKDGHEMNLEVVLSPVKDSTGQVIGVSTIARDITKRKQVEEALRESEEHLRFVIDASNDGIWEWDVVSGKVMWSERIYTLLGLSPESFQPSYESQFALIHPEDVATFERAIQEHLETGVPYHLRVRYRHSNGSYLHVLAQGRTQRDDEGRALRMVGSFSDLTRLIQAEMEHEAKSREIVAIWESMTDAFFSLDTQWRFTGINRQTERLWNRNAKELIGKNIWDEFPAVVGSEFHRQYSHAMKEQVAVTFEAFYAPSHAWREVHAYPSPSGLSVYFHDITGRKKAEEERDRFFTISLDLLCVADHNGYFKRLNPAFEEVLGYSNADLMTKPFLEWVHPDDREATLAVMKDLDGGTPTLKFANRYLCRDGSYRWLSWVAVPFEDVIYAVAHDITALKDAEMALHRANTELEMHVMERTVQLKAANESLRVENIQHQMTMETLREFAQALQEAKEEADRANAAKSEFLSRMSHELRTPLNAILGFGQIMEMRSQGADLQQKNNIGQILKGGRHLLGLINEVLDIARVEAGHIELSLEPVALNEIVPEVGDLVLPLAAQRGIRLDYNPCKTGKSDGAGEHHVLADWQRLKQVLLNLLSNAIKYNREGGQVEVSCEAESEGVMVIRVRDTGVGIAPHDLPKLFVPFERLGAANSSIEGTGLGLVLSKRLVGAMNGALDVESVQGEGTTFTLTLPQVTSPQKQMLNQLEDKGVVPLDTAPQATPTSSVLCIEDNPSNLRLIEIVLQSRPHVKLLPAVQGSIGLDLARQHSPDLILLDLHLPDMSGAEVLAVLRQSPSTRDIPVIVISADATERQTQRLLEAGAMAYLTKPLDVPHFLRLLDEVLLA